MVQNRDGYGALKQAMEDPDRADYGARVSNGKVLNIRASQRLAAQFPDGCDCTPSMKDGKVVLSLRNRITGPSWMTAPDGTAAIVISGKSAGLKDAGVPHFGATAVEKVESGPGGSVVVTLPLNLTPKVWGSNKPKSKKPSAPRTLDKTPVLELSEQEAEQPLTECPASAELAQSSVPAIDVRQAVEALNAWKVIMGENLSITQRPDGGVSALAQYGA